MLDIGKADGWVGSAQALQALNVQAQTLYAYVSRGLVRAMPDPADPRRSVYAVHDLRALLERRRHPRRRAEIAAGAIAWGAPVLESALSTVRDGRLVYRGRDAARLAARATLEDVATLLWTGAEPAPAPRAPRGAARSTGESGAATPLPASPRRGAAAGTRSHAGATRTQRIEDCAQARGFRWLAAAAATQAPSFGRSETLQQADARAIVEGFADALAGQPGHGPVHGRLAAAWRLDRRGSELLRQALVLVCDHELNASTFAVRVAVSTGASMAAAALAGYCTLSGPLHGQAGVASLAMLRRMLDVRDPEAFVRACIGRGEPLAGFGHPLYPQGDVRATELLDALRPAAPVRRAIGAAARVAGQPPNVDMALAALAHQLRLADDAPFALFAAGRMAGWLAHAMEQRRSGRLIRPRATYVGE